MRPQVATGERLYTEKEAMDASLEYFNGNELARDVTVDKYLLRDNDGNFLERTLGDVYERLAKEFARIDSEKYGLNYSERLSVYQEALGRIVPQGSPLASVGNDYQIMSCSNCIVLAPPDDSIAGIMRTATDLAQLQKRRAGVGFDISSLRPEGAPVRNAGKTSSGAWSFSDLFSFVTRMIGQAKGRRGALMLSLSVHHPDVEKFITMKQNLTKVTGANVSVRISDEFMKAVQENREYEQRWPEENPTIRKMVSADKIWDLIAESARRSAEPGVLFWDTIKRELPADYYDGFECVGVNPCQPAWASVLTPDGIRTLNDVSIGSVIWSGNQWTKITNKQSTGVKPLFAFKTRAGIFYGTEEHKVIQDGERIEVKEAETIDTSQMNLEFIKDMGEIDPQDVVDGLVLGDGTVHKASGDLILLIIGQNDKDYLSSEINKFLIEERAGIGRNRWTIKTKIKSNELVRTYNRKIPDRFRFGCFSKIRGFLRGLFSANGSVLENHGRVTLKASSIDVIEITQEMLSSIGIKSYYTVNKQRDTEFKNGVYTCKESYDLSITTDRNKFYSLIGFIQEYKNEKLNKICNKSISKYANGCSKNSYEIVSKEFLGEEEVFDITVDSPEHTYWTGGLLVSNCSELSLSASDSCRLASINLTQYVHNAFTKQAVFDYDLFGQDVETAVQILDNLVDLELEKIEKIKKIADSQSEKELWQKLYESAYNGRRIGLGAHGLADMLAQLCIKYNSKEAISFMDDIYGQSFQEIAYYASVELARQRGAFPIYNHKTEKNCPFIQRLPEYVQEDMQAYGRRNISLLTMAPTGSISIISKCGEFNSYNISSGIEPVFRNSYVRRKKINGYESDMIDFIDQNGDKWQNYAVLHGNVRCYKDKTGSKDLPDYFVTSDKIDWKARVELQATITKYTDHSIASTLNLPKGTNSETIKQIYTNAWETGCKGVTVYVDGCRSGVLVEQDKTDCDGGLCQIKKSLENNK